MTHALPQRVHPCSDSGTGGNLCRRPPLLSNGSQLSPIRALTSPLSTSADLAECAESVLSLHEPLEGHVAQELYTALRRAESRLDVDIEITVLLVEAAVSVKRLSQEEDLRSDDGSSYAADDSDAEQPLDPAVAHATPTAPAATPSLAH